ncbi:MAG: TRAP transporter large permease subunit, partial [Thermaurantiacus sp.]
MTAAGFAFVALFALLVVGVPIAFALVLVGVGGFAVIVGPGPALAMLAQNTVDTGLAYHFSVLPMFLLMGNVIARTPLAEELYEAANAFFGHARGGLAHATIISCGAFGAVCGSSMATTATMTRIAVPTMRARGYAPSLAMGSVAAGGTLGILIPPSVAMVLYGR